MNRLTLLAALAALLALPVAAQELRPRIGVEAAAVTTPATAPIVTPLDGAERTAALALANQTLNAVLRLQGRFVQSSPGGARAAGAFYLQRPGKLRFQYDPPAALLIIADGSVVALRDTQLRTTERTPLRSTPLHLILGAQIDLARDARITQVARSGPWLMISARDRGGQTDGQITLHFFGPNAELRSWDVLDVTGARTRITLSELTQPASLDGRLFRLDDVLIDRPGQRR